MDCDCHGEAMLWSRDSRYRAGGFWYCAVKNRERLTAYYAEHAEKIRAARRDRYDADPIYRIGKRLRDDARIRAATLARRREDLANG